MQLGIYGLGQPMNKQDKGLGRNGPFKIQGLKGRIFVFLKWSAESTGMNGRSSPSLHEEPYELGYLSCTIHEEHMKQMTCSGSLSSLALVCIGRGNPWSRWSVEWGVTVLGACAWSLEGLSQIG